MKREGLFLLFLGERLQFSSKERFEFFGPAIARECIGKQRFLTYQQGTGCDVCAGDDAASLAGYVNDFDDVCLDCDIVAALTFLQSQMSVCGLRNCADLPTAGKRQQSDDA